MRAWTRAALAATVAVVVGCGSDSTGPTTDDLTGTWRVTKLEFVNVANQTNRVDAIALGGNATITLNADHTFSLIATLPGELAETVTGTWASSQDTFSMFPTGMSGSWVFDMSLSGSTLTIGGANVDFDFNDDGVDEPAKLNMVLVRQ